MYYNTVPFIRESKQISWDDLFDEREIKNYTYDKTATRTSVISEIFYTGNEVNIITALSEFVVKYKTLIETDKSTLYHTFYIPKRSGGWRRIDAPNEELMTALNELKNIFENVAGLKYHTAAFAYVKGRSTLDAVRKHQKHESNWFLKTDFSNFFGSTTKEFVMRMMSMLNPVAFIFRGERNKEVLSQALELCFLNGGLPQGTPISPTLTNIMMIPIDHKLYNDLSKQNFIYTRYADDILVSSKTTFVFSEIVKKINEALVEFEAPFRINNKKTRYESKNGSNWNLGLMLNKDNDITIGYKKKKIFKAMANNFVLDTANNKNWSRDELNYFSGLISYYGMIENDFVNEVFAKLKTKYGYDGILMLKKELRK